MTAMVMALLTVAGVLFLLWKLDIRKALWLDIPLDIIVSVGVLWLFSGTLTGAFAAVIAGAVFSLTLLALKRTMGYKRLRRKGKSFLWERAQ